MRTKNSNSKQIRSVKLNQINNHALFNVSYFGGILKIKPKKCDKIVTFINN